MLNDIQRFACTKRKRGWRRPWEEREREREGARSRTEVSMEASRAGEQGGGGHVCVKESFFFGEGSLVLVQREVNVRPSENPFFTEGAR